MNLAGVACCSDLSGNGRLNVIIPSAATLIIGKVDVPKASSRHDLEGLTNFSYKIRDDSGDTGTIQLELARQQPGNPASATPKIGNDVLRWSCFRLGSAQAGSVPNGSVQSCSGEHLASSAVQTVFVKLNPTTGSTGKTASLGWKPSDDAFAGVGANTTLTLTISGL